MSVTVMTLDEVKVLMEEVVAKTVAETMKKTEFIPREKLFNSFEAARILGLDVDNMKKASITIAMQKFRDKKLYPQPLKTARVAGNKYRYGDLIDFIESNIS